MGFGRETRGLRSVHWLFGVVLTLGACGSDSGSGTESAGGTPVTPDAAAGGGGAEADAAGQGGTPITPDAAVATPDAAAPATAASDPAGDTTVPVASPFYQAPNASDFRTLSPCARTKTSCSIPRPIW